MVQETLGFEETSKIVSLTSQAIKGPPNPFFTSADLIRDSKNKLEAGESNLAVIESVTAVEIFVSTLIRLDMEGQGFSKERVDNALETGFKNKLRDQLGRRMGFALRSGSFENPIEKWYGEAYDLRNNVVHQGGAVSAEEARKAFEQTNEALTFLQDKIKQDTSNKFAHIRRFMVGETYGL